MTLALHITNGDSAAGTMREAGIDGEILPWRDVLHDGPVPAGLPLHDLSEVRALYLASEGLGDPDQLLKNFASRDAVLERYAEYDPIVLWFEWDLYDQLQLLQILDFFAAKAGSSTGGGRPTIELVSVAGYLGTMSPAELPALHARRIPVTPEVVSLGRAGWRAFTSFDPYDVTSFLTTDTSALPFLDSALWRLLEELPSARNGLARSERQLLEGIDAGATRFGELFQRAASLEERIYCGDASAALYLERLSRGSDPLVVYPSGERVVAPRGDAAAAPFRSAELSLTDAGKAVLSGARDWIEIAGSDRWLGGVHLDGRNAAWRWDEDARAVRDAEAA